MPRTAGDLLGSPYFSFEIASMHARYLTAGRDFFCLQLKYIYIYIAIQKWRKCAVLNISYFRHCCYQEFHT